VTDEKYYLEGDSLLYLLVTAFSCKWKPRLNKNVRRSLNFSVLWSNDRKSVTGEKYFLEGDCLLYLLGFVRFSLKQRKLGRKKREKKKKTFFFFLEGFSTVYFFFSYLALLGNLKLKKNKTMGEVVSGECALLC
jgi:hypothetical protein